MKRTTDYQVDTVEGLMILEDGLLIGGLSSTEEDSGFVMIGELSR